MLTIDNDVELVTIDDGIVNGLAKATTIHGLKDIGGSRFTGIVKIRQTAVNARRGVS